METASVAYGPVEEASAVMAEWSADDPAISVGDRVVYVTHRRADGAEGRVPVRARYKVHSASLGDLTRLVTLIIHVEDGAPAGLHETLVSTGARGEGEVLARGYGHRDQPMILVFRLEPGGARLASA